VSQEIWCDKCAEIIREALYRYDEEFRGKHFGITPVRHLAYPGGTRESAWAGHLGGTALNCEVIDLGQVLAPLANEVCHTATFSVITDAGDAFTLRLSKGAFAAISHDTKDQYTF
jgi:hypothetical protein